MKQDIQSTEVADDLHLTLGHPEEDMKLSRHCLATIVVSDVSKLYDSKSFGEAVHAILDRENVMCVGEASHDFNNNSFTTVFALAESHISIHTWPERSVVQLDVFLCNYIHDNTGKCERLFEAIIDYFGDAEVQKTYIDRQ